MIFVDTSAWFARIVPTDLNHPTAVSWDAQNIEPYLTTSFVVDETPTLLKMRGQMKCALAFGEAVFGGDLASVHYLTPEEIETAWRLFRQYRDKEWSFTDCTSKIVMDEMGIRRAFAFDQHFIQFGSVEVVPAIR